MPLEEIKYETDSKMHWIYQTQFINYMQPILQQRLDVEFEEYCKYPGLWAAETEPMFIIKDHYERFDNVYFIYFEYNFLYNNTHVVKNFGQSYFVDPFSDTSKETVSKYKSDMTFDEVKKEYAQALIRQTNYMLGEDSCYVKFCTSVEDIEKNINK